MKFKAVYDPEFDLVERLGEADPDYEEKRLWDLRELENETPKRPELIEEPYPTLELEELVEELEKRPQECSIDLKII